MIKSADEISREIILLSQDSGDSVFSCVIDVFEKYQIDHIDALKFLTPQILSVLENECAEKRMIDATPVKSLFEMLK